MARQTNAHAAGRTIRLGFVPLTDCAPLVVAQELGFFSRYGLSVELHREIGWATLRDKIAYGNLEAAHALAPMAFALHFGWGVPRTECLSGLVMSLEGNAITLSRARFNEKESSDWGLVFKGIKKPLTFAIPFTYSAHRFLIQAWISSLQVEPDRVARLVVVPPPQMTLNLKAGNLDGFCVGEPWNSFAVGGRAGWIAATSAELDECHPEKVLLIRREFADDRPSEHEALIAAILEACRFCADPINAEKVRQVLARANYLGAAGAFVHGVTLRSRSAEASMPNRLGPVFFGSDVNRPDKKKASWVAQHLHESGLTNQGLSALMECGKRTFCPDIFDAAQRIQFQSDQSSTLSKQPYEVAN